MDKFIKINKKMN